METSKEVNSNFKIQDGGWGWLVLFASFSAHFIIDGITNSLGTYLDVIAKEFELSLPQISLIFSFLPATTLLTGTWFLLYLKLMLSNAVN